MLKCEVSFYKYINNISGFQLFDGFWLGIIYHFGSECEYIYKLIKYSFMPNYSSSVLFRHIQNIYCLLFFISLTFFSVGQENNTIIQINKDAAEYLLYGFIISIK